MTIIAVVWLGTVIVLLGTCKNSSARFQAANLLSIGVLGVVFHGRKPADITQREKVGFLLLLTVFVAAITATIAGFI